jgi:hypothetical protein
MDKVTELYPDSNPNYILEQAFSQYESLLLLGYDEEGYLSSMSSTNLTKGDLLWLVEMFKQEILLKAEPEDE